MCPLIIYHRTTHVIVYAPRPWYISIIYLIQNSCWYRHSANVVCSGAVLPNLGKTLATHVTQYEVQYEGYLNYLPNGLAVSMVSMVSQLAVVFVHGVLRCTVHVRVHIHVHVCTVPAQYFTSKIWFKL